MYLLVWAWFLCRWEDKSILTWECARGRLLTEYAGSNPAGGVDVCLLWGCVLSGRGHCDGLNTRPEESSRVWCVWVRSWNLNNEDALPIRGYCPRGERVLTRSIILIFMLYFAAKRNEKTFNWWIDLKFRKAYLAYNRFHEIVLLISWEF